MQRRFLIDARRAQQAGGSRTRSLEAQSHRGAWLVLASPELSLVAALDLETRMLELGGAGHSGPCTLTGISSPSAGNK